MRIIKIRNGSALNDEGFSYGQGGAAMRDSGAGWYNHLQKGFISRYSTSGLEEDKASVFACLMVDETRKKIMSWAESDEILKNKVDYMIEFAEGVCWEMGDVLRGK